MILLATGEPNAKVEGDKIAVTIGSGKDSVTIALDPHQAMMLVERTRRATSQMIEATRFRPTGEIVDFASAKRALRSVA